MPVDDEIRILGPSPKEMKGVLDRIKILPVVSQPDDMTDLVNILDGSSEGAEIGTEPALRLAVSAQGNRETAQLFYSVLRTSLPDLIPITHFPDYKDGQWLAYNDLAQLADRWNLPLGLVWKDRDHWNLMLEPPIQELKMEAGGESWKWKVMVYDPWHQDSSEERWIYLPEEFTGKMDVADQTRGGIFVNRLAMDQLTSGEYHFSLYGDREIADNSELYAAKMAQTQLATDSSNCGLACLFMAALREGVKDGWSPFKFSGRDQMDKDTGIRVLTREEILHR